jgi:hypothetical protein
MLRPRASTAKLLEKAVSLVIAGGFLMLTSFRQRRAVAWFTNLDTVRVSSHLAATVFADLN